MATPVPALRVRLLGGLEIDGVDPARFGSRKARTLVRLLALAEGAPVPVDAIVDALWGDDPPAVPADQVAVLVSRVRAVLGVETVSRTDSGYALAVDWLDHRAARDLVTEARRRLERGAPAAGRAAADAAVRLFRGPLLADEIDAPWVRTAREAAGRLEGEARQLAALGALTAGDLRSAVAAAEDQLTRDAFDEVALRVAVVALVRLGNRSAALDRYERFRRGLADELGVDPAHETAAVHLAILQNREIPAFDGVGGVRAARTKPVVPPGRDAAVRAFTAALDRAAGGRAELLGIDGEPGMGKTHLLRALGAHAEAGGAVVLTARCDELGNALPLAALFQALNAHLAGLDDVARATVLGEDRPLLDPLLDWRAGAVPDAWLGALTDPTAGRLLLFGALLRVVDRLGGHAAVVLLVDDAHRAADATVGWLHYARRHGDGVRLLIVVAGRPGEGPELDADERITLEPLDVESAAMLVGRERAADYVARSDGNPLYLLELAAAPDSALPPSLMTAVQERCARTGAAATLLRNAAVLGPDIDVDLLASVLRIPVIDLLDGLEVGVAHGLLDDGDGRLRFHHALVREALVEQTRGNRRALLHREAGRALAARPQPEPLRVAYHARLGGDTALASTQLVAAARASALHFDLAAARRLVDEAVALEDSAQSRLERARIRIAQGDHAGGAEDAAEARRLGAGTEALEVEGVAAYYRRDFEAAARIAEAGRDASGGTGVLALLGGRVAHAAGDLRSADAALTAPASGDAGQMKAIWLSFLRVHEGRSTEALALLDGQTGAGATPAHLFAPHHVFFTRAYAEASLGHAAVALAVLDQLAELVAHDLSGHWAGRAENIRGWVLRNLGEHAAADEWNHRGLALAEAVGYTEAQAHALLDLADGRLVAGDTAAVRSLLDRAAPFHQRDHAFRWRHQLRARLLEVRLLILEGAYDEAAELAATMARDAAGLRAAKYAVLGRLASALANARAGHEVTAADHDGDVSALDSVAGLEAWWITADLASAVKADAWSALASRRAAALAAGAGDYAESVARSAGTRLSSTRSTQRSG